MPLFSVVVPTYNRLDLLEEALASVWAQTWTDFEVIVVDDGSTDGTSEWLQGQPRVKLLRQANCGHGAARNRAAREAKGEYLACLDSDDRWFPWTLARLAEAIERHGRPALMLGTPVEVRSDDWTGAAAARDAPLRCEPFHDYLASSSRALFPGTCVCVARRDCLLSAGGFAESLRCAEDIDLFLRLGTEAGFLHIGQPCTVAYRRHGGGLTSDHHAAVAGMAFLIEGERAGRYPGGAARARERREIISRSVRAVSVAAIGHVSVRAAARLYWQTLGWHLSALRIKYLAGFWALAAAALLAPRRIRTARDGM
jgi:glycosyltransferase involved in cell wall biosynthesis